MRKLIFLAMITGLTAMPDVAVAQATKGSHGGAIVKSEGHPIEFVRNGLDITFMWATTTGLRSRQRR